MDVSLAMSDVTWKS